MWPTPIITITRIPKVFIFVLGFVLVISFTRGLNCVSGYTCLMFLSTQHQALSYSPFLNQLVNRHPDWLQALKSSGRLAAASTPDKETLSQLVKDVGLEPALRQFRNKEMMRLIWRDLNDLAPVDEVLADLSVLADICLQSAIEHHTNILEHQYGTPRGPNDVAQKLVVIGLGKLGGGELNLSSDIDIIFCFPDNGVCDGRRHLANEQFFTRMARLVIRSLSEITADGFCFRVDTRLRPFGASGPLVCSFAALEQYYQREGRDWERYAWIKARPVGGDHLAGKQLLGLLNPFVYRRYIDFGAIEALREMHANVSEDARRKDRLDDIKRGPGGIREIEFLVQSFQLLRGGRDKGLQSPSIVSASHEIKRLELLPSRTIEELLEAYRFLRRVENRIQALHDQQTHQLPQGEDGLRVAQAMGFSNMDVFKLALDDTRDHVQVLFKQSLPQTGDSDNESNPWHDHWQSLRNNVQRDEADISEDKLLADFIKRLNRLSLSQRASTRLDKFMPLLLERFAATSPSEEVIQGVLDLVSGICRRSAYLSLLVQNPGATNRMLELFTTSKRVAQAVTRYPALLDELIDPSLGVWSPTDKDIQTGVQRIMHAGTDTETRLQELNYFKQVIGLRVAVAVLNLSMTTAAACTALSQLARALLQATLELANVEMESRHGKLPGPGLAVIAYGSLGALALGFDSDLDLIFLYNPVLAASDGARPIHAERFHTGVARRMLSLLSATTPSGRLYNIDSRLRPNGRSGLLVSSVDAFKRYQATQAWVWELQALTRARLVVGNVEIGKKFTSIRQEVLTASRDKDQVRLDVLEMRERLRAEHGDSTSLKHGPGGLLDIQFVVQLGMLLNAEAHPAILNSTSLTDQLQFLHDCRWIDESTLEALTKAHTRLSHALQQISLVDDKSDDNCNDLLNIAGALCDALLR